MFQSFKDILDPPLKNHKIFFFHIAKCGGTSINKAIIDCYKPWRNNRSNSVVLLNEEAARFTEQKSMEKGNDIRRDLLNYTMSLPEVNCIVGHFHYSQDTFDVFHNQWNFVTILRNPVDRWFSHYHYNQKSSSKFKIDIPLEKFIETEAATNFGRAFVDEITDDLNKEHLNIKELTDIAIDRYKKFALVGALENMTQFEEIFEAKFNSKLSINHLNKTSTNTPDIPSDIYQRVTKLCEPDTYLYKKVLGL
jgi:hypothetical protein